MESSDSFRWMRVSSVIHCPAQSQIIVEPSISRTQSTRPCFSVEAAFAILIILEQTQWPNERWCILTEQPRVAAYSLRFLEIPAGMMGAICAEFQVNFF